MKNAASYTRPGNILNREDIIKAARDGANKLVESLLSQGVDANTSDADGFTVTHIACMQGNHELVDIILKCGQNVDFSHQNSLGLLAWQMAAKYGHMELASKALGPQAQKGIVLKFPTPAP